MSVMFTLIRLRPILLSSGSTFLRISARKLSRSWLICSIVSEATVRRSWPKMISLAMPSIASARRPRSRSAAFTITAGSVETPTVKVDGTLMRMFWNESAFCRGMLIVIGVRPM